MNIIQLLLILNHQLICILHPDNYPKMCNGQIKKKKYSKIQNSMNK